MCWPWKTAEVTKARPVFGPIMAKGFTGAYVRDPDGNKLAFVCYDATPVTQE